MSRCNRSGDMAWHYNSLCVQYSQYMCEHICRCRNSISLNVNFFSLGVNFIHIRTYQQKIRTQAFVI